MSNFIIRVTVLAIIIFIACGALFMRPTLNMKYTGSKPPLRCCWHRARHIRGMATLHHHHHHRHHHHHHHHSNQLSDSSLILSLLCPLFAQPISPFFQVASPSNAPFSSSCIFHSPSLLKTAYMATMSDWLLSLPYVFLLSVARP